MLHIRNGDDWRKVEVEPNSTIPLPFTSTGDQKLDYVFAKAEKRREVDFDEQCHLVTHRVFVRHPRYPKCTGLLVSIMPPMQEGEGTANLMVKDRRTITDDCRTPVKAISQVARYLAKWGTEAMTRRRGGPEPTPEEDKVKIVKGWREVKGTGKMTQETYALSRWIDPRTLRRWERELEEEGKL
jgi:hypothetical protein